LSDANNDKLTLRIITPALHGNVTMDGTSATYTPEPGFAADDTFMFAANDTATDSNLSTDKIHVK
jgi:Bacterial Ig domain